MTSRRRVVWRLRIERSLFFIALLAAWELSARALGPTTMPAPLAVLDVVPDIVRAEDFRADLVLTLQQVVLALAIALVVGGGLGVLGWRYKLVRRSLFPWLALLNAVPSVLFYPVAIVLLGLGTASTVALSVFLGGMVITESTFAGLSSVSKVHLEVAACFRASQRDVFRKVLLPGAMEIISTGVRVGFTLVFVVVIATGYILSGGGLGYRLRFYYEAFQMPQLYALVLIVVALSLVFQLLFVSVLGWAGQSTRTSEAQLAVKMA